MAFMDVKAVYRSVIDEVTTKSLPEFVQEGIDEAVLDELRELWEEKLQASGVLAPPAERARVEPVNGAAHLGHQGYISTVQHTPNAANIGRPPTYLTSAPWMQRPAQGMQTVQTGAPAAQPYSAINQYLARQPGGMPQLRPSSQQYLQPQQVLTSSNGHRAAAAPQAASAYQQHVQPTQQGQQAGVNGVNHAGHAGTGAHPPQPGQYATHGGASQAPQAGNPVQMPTMQNQGAVQGAPAWQGPVIQATVLDEATRKRKAEELQAAYQRAAQRQMLSHQQQAHVHPNTQSSLPQQDGPAEEGSAEKDKDSSENEEEPEREELENFSDVASSDGDEDDSLPNQCISQFVKVQRTKNKWKCQLLSGVMHLNGRDHVFGSANGEFQF